MFTTSRYASAESARVAKAIASRLKTIFCARGKKTIAQLVEQARRDGEDRINIVMEKNDLPSIVLEIEVLPRGKYRWLARHDIKEFEKHESKISH